MKKRKSVFFNVAVLGTLGMCSLLVACDEAYDLDKMSGDVQLFGNGVTAPLGETTKFYLSEFITDSGTLVIEDGTYKIKFSGDANTNFSVPAMIIDPIVPEIPPSIIDFYESLGNQYPEVKEILDMLGYHKGDPIPDIPGGIHITKHIEAIIEDNTETFPLTVHDIPEEVKNIQSIAVTQESDILFELESHGMPNDVHTVHLDFHFTVPKQFQVTPLSDDVVALGNNQYTLVRDVSSDDGSFSTIVPMHIKWVEFNPPLERHDDGAVRLDLEVIYGGKIEIMDPDVNLVGWVPVTELDIYFHSTAIEATELTACLQTDIEPVNFSQKLEGLPDMFNDPDTRLDLQLATINMDIQNTTPAGVEATFELRSLFCDGSYSPWVKTEQPLAINAASTQHIVITNDEAYAGTPGYIYNLNELLDRVPQELYGVATPYMPMSDMTIALNKTYDILANYDIVVPLDFGNGINLHLADEIGGFGSDIQEITNYLSHVVLRGDAISTIPLDLAMTFTPLDASKNEIKGLVVSRIPTIKGNGTTTLEIVIKETTSGALKKLDALRYELSGTSETGGELRTDQYLQLTKLSLELPDGIKLSLKGE